MPEPLFRRLGARTDFEQITIIRPEIHQKYGQLYSLSTSTGKITKTTCFLPLFSFLFAFFAFCDIMGMKPAARRPPAPKQTADSAKGGSAHVLQCTAALRAGLFHYHQQRRSAAIIFRLRRALLQHQYGFSISISFTRCTSCWTAGVSYHRGRLLRCSL